MFPPHGGQDRAAVQQFDDRMVLVVADGAGGMGGGAQAAQYACDRAMQLAQLATAEACIWVDRLRAIDTELSVAEHGGQCTLVVAEVWNGQVVGASVGDSEAWLIGHGDTLVLTEQQERKPLLGSGSARTRGFGPFWMRGWRLLIASDGLFRFAARDKIAQRVRSTVFPQLPSLLTDLARLPNGELQDDVAIVVCEANADGTG